MALQRNHEVNISSSRAQSGHTTFCFTLEGALPFYRMDTTPWTMLGHSLHQSSWCDIRHS